MQGAALVGFGVGVHGCDGKAGVAQGVAYEGNACTTIQGVAGMAMAQPVGADVAGNASALGGNAHNAVYLAGVKRATFLAGEDG